MLGGGLAFLVGFLLGSIPAAWVIVRLVTRKDLSTSGSTNVGALNALRVSKSKWVGVGVLVFDALKGALSVFVGGFLATQFGSDVIVGQSAGAVGAVAGHNYNPWLSMAAGKLVGGKGFAAAAGALFAFMPWIVPAWLGLSLLAWLVFKFWRGITDEAPATAFASLAIIPIAYQLYGTPGAVVTTGFAVVIMPKLVREVRLLLFTRPPDATT